MYELNFEDNYYMWEYVYSDAPVRVFAEDKFMPHSPDGPDWCGLARYPYYQLRGKPVTPEQAVEIYAKTDRFFNERLCMEGSINLGIFPYVWTHPCGEVWQNDHFLYKWAELHEMAEDLIPIVRVFPYLDMIAAVTYWDCNPPSEDDCYRDTDFFNNIEFGIWVHDKMIEFIDPKKTQKLYKEYDKFYTDKQPDDFEETYAFMKKCFKVYGIDDMEEYIEKRWKELHCGDNYILNFLGRTYGK